MGHEKNTGFLNAVLLPDLTLIKEYIILFFLSTRGTDFYPEAEPFEWFPGWMPVNFSSINNA